MKIFNHKKYIFLWLVNLMIYSTLYSQHFSIDSAKKNIANSTKMENYLRTAFYIADGYMDLQQYDSAQIWLNKIYDKLPVKNATLFNYFLITRQSEVYYYNDLQQLGLQESYRGLQMAKELNDSLLLADSYNFLGLFYMNIDSSKTAIQFYKNGLRFTRQPPYASIYLSLTKPHHLYGNMSEAYYKLSKFDSALTNSSFSIKKANQINDLRGIALGHNIAGDIHLVLKQYDSALYHYHKCKLTAQQSNNIDVELICLGGISKTYFALKNTAKFTQYLSSGFDILKKYPNLNRYYALQFLSSAIQIYKSNNDKIELVKTLELKSNLESQNLRNTNTQLKTILKAGVANEKRLLSLEVTDAKQKQKIANTRLVIVLIAFILLALGFILYRYLQNQKIAAAKLRQKISQDLHDDIGASLSSLQIYSSIAEKNIIDNAPKAIEMINKIAAQSKLLMENMNDIVWSMNTSAVGNTTLEAKIKNYGAELLGDKNIAVTYIISDNIDKLLQNVNARKNILLVIKEAMNNIAKYSGATNANLTLLNNQTTLALTISDNGIGFNLATAIKGNGLKNMQYRVTELQSIIHIITAPNQGTTLTAIIPLTVL